VPGKLSSNYLSEKTYGLILSKIPFISTHTYPLDILEKILGIERHPFYTESERCINNPEKFVEFVKKFMENFEINNNLCILWTDKVHNLLMNKINNENSLLNILINNFEKINVQSSTQKII
jgi:ribosomal protein L31